MGDGHFKQFMRLRKQLVIAAENFDRVEKLSPVLIPTMSKDMDDQMQLAHWVVDIVDREDRKNCVTLRPFNVNKPESSYSQMRKLARKTEDEIFQRIIYEKVILEKFIYFHDVTNSFFDKTFTDKNICIVL